MIDAKLLSIRVCFPSYQQSRALNDCYVTPSCPDEGLVHGSPIPPMAQSLDLVDLVEALTVHSWGHR